MPVRMASLESDRSLNSRPLNLATDHIRQQQENEDYADFERAALPGHQGQRYVEHISSQRDPRPRYPQRSLRREPRKCQTERERRQAEQRCGKSKVQRGAQALSQDPAHFPDDEGNQQRARQWQEKTFQNRAPAEYRLRLPEQHQKAWRILVSRRPLIDRPHKCQARRRHFGNNDSYRNAVPFAIRRDAFGNL